MMLEILKFSVTGFWPFVTFTMLLGWSLVITLGIAHHIFKIYNRTLRVITMWKNGYPPAHCDADGDQLEDYKEEV